MVFSINPAHTASRLSFGKQPAPPVNQPGSAPMGPNGVPLRPNGKPSKLTPEMRKVLDHLKDQLRRRSPNGEIQEKDALAAVTTLINMQKGTQFAETDYTRMVGGLMGPMNPHRNNPQWIAQKNQFQQRQGVSQPGMPTNAYTQGYPQQNAYRPNPYAQSYGAGYTSSYNPYGYQQGWGQQAYATNNYYPGNIRYF